MEREIPGSCLSSGVRRWPVLLEENRLSVRFGMYTGVTMGTVKRRSYGKVSEAGPGDQEEEERTSQECSDR